MSFKDYLVESLRNDDIYRQLVEEFDNEQFLFEKSFSDLNKNNIIDKIIDLIYYNAIYGTDDKSSAFSFVEYWDEEGLNKTENSIYDLIRNKDKNFDKWLRQYISEKLPKIWNELKLFSQKGIINIYRGMEVSEDWLQSLIEKGKHLGIYWTRNIDSAKSIRGPGDSKNIDIIIFSKIDEKYVDWISTFFNNLSPAYGEREKEITLFKGTPIKISNIYDKDKKSLLSNAFIKISSKIENEIFYA